MACLNSKKWHGLITFFKGFVCHEWILDVGWWERLVHVIVLLLLGVEGRKCHFYSDTPMFFFPGVILWFPHKVKAMFCFYKRINWYCLMLFWWFWYINFLKFKNNIISSKKYLKKTCITITCKNNLFFNLLFLSLL